MNQTEVKLISSSGNSYAETYQLILQRKSKFFILN